MKLIARKACSFGGKKFYIGDEIPAELVLDPKTQEQREVLAIVHDGAWATAPAVDPAGDTGKIPVVIHDNEGDLTLDLAQEDIQTIVDILTDTVEGAEPIVAQMTNGDALILLDCIDSRKSIKTAARNRAQELAEAEENEADEPTEPDDPEESEGDQ